MSVQKTARSGRMHWRQGEMETYVLRCHLAVMIASRVLHANPDVSASLPVQDVVIAASSHARPTL